MAVIEALGAIGDPRAIEPIIAASQGLDERLVYQALEHLGKPRSRTSPKPDR